MSGLKCPVLVTGATSGLGFAIGRYLIEQGVHVFAGYRKHGDVGRLHDAMGTRVTPIQIDIADVDSVAAAESQLKSAAPDGLSGLVNNAGIAIAGPLEATPPSDIDRQFEVNVVGAIRVTQACLPLLRLGSGRVLHIGSAAGSFALPFVGPYAASKFAMEAISDSMRRELRPFSIPVSLIRPGRMATEIFNRAETDAIERFEHLDAAQRDRYEPALRRFQTLMHRSEHARCEPVRVAKVVYRALVARRPRARYNVGIDATLAAQVQKWAPDWLTDWIVARVTRPR